MTTNSIPALNLPLSYINGMNLAWASNTTLTVTSGQCRDSSNTFDIVVSTASTTINAASNGLNGLDTGSLGASTWYYVYAISNSTDYLPSGFLLSVSATAPTMPAGYDIIRRIGYARTDGSSHFVKFYQSGNGSNRKYFWDAKPSGLAAGTATSYTAVDLSVGVPPVANLEVEFEAYYTPNAAGDVAAIRPTGSSSTSFAAIKGAVAAVPQLLQIQAVTGLSSGVAKIDYIVTASDQLSLDILSFVDSL